MTNHYKEAISGYRDIESLAFHRRQSELGKPEAEIMDYLALRSRDQGRTPMQWNDGYSAGFSTGEPWIGLNPDYPSVNVEHSLAAQDSILHFYRTLIELRRSHKALIYGDFQEIYPESEQLGGYTRTYQGTCWTILCNFTDQRVSLSAPLAGEIILSNTDSHEAGILKPYEAVISRRDE
ncbi:Oligo-1,6-glucosidase [compost metagenome]